MDDELLAALRYKSEGTDIDFKSAQYRFVGGSQEDKAEMLKDILAMANAWRDGTGYILLGFRDQRPHPAEVVGITDHIDDAAIQQFVHGKVKPKLTFRYEEHLYEGKTVGVISIPKQKRPFYVANDYGKVRSNIVYVRRGSSTGEAEPPEIADMQARDAGRGAVKVELALTTPKGDALLDSVSLNFLQFTEELPDYETPRERGSYDALHFRPLTVWRDNKDFWREAAKYVRYRDGLIEMRFVLRNRSEVQLTNAKLEVEVDSVDGQDCEMFAGDELPEVPSRQWNTLHISSTLPEMLSRRDPDLIIDETGEAPACHVRFGSLLPGEDGRSSDTMALLLGGPGKLRLRCRILAAELPAPIAMEREMDVSGTTHRLDFDGFKEYLTSRPQDEE
ncbi:Divergent AAA domain protein [compost metagenome]